MQPTHPADSSYARAAEALASRDFEVAAERRAGRSTASARRRRRAGHRPPLRPEWEATTARGRPALSDRELDAIEEFVRGGGGLIVLGETEQEKYGNNLNELLARFGIEIENGTVQDYEHHRDGAVLGAGRPGGPTAPTASPTASTCSPASARPASTAPALWRSTTAAA